MTKPLTEGERSAYVTFTVKQEDKRRLETMFRQGERSAFIRKAIDRAWQVYQAEQEPLTEEGNDEH